jgi:hypothetical protein
MRQETRDNRQEAKGRVPKPGKAGKEGWATEYKKEYCGMLVEHFRVEPQRIVSKETYYADGGLKSKEEELIAAEFPTFQGFADKIGAPVCAFDEWKAKYPDFAEAYARAGDLQEHIWLVNGMSGLYDFRFAQFFGVNRLGYRQKQETDGGGRSGKITVEIELPEDIQKWAK